MNTKQRILDAALDLFSRRGFSAVSVRDLAAAVGVKESALYKHFRNKRAVLDTLVARYREASERYMSGIHAQPPAGPADPGALEAGAAFYESLDDAAFLRTSKRLFTDFLMHPDTMRFWRMVSIERCNDPDMAALFYTMLHAEPMAFQTALFSVLIGRGAMRPVDPSVLAMEFFMPALMIYLHLLPWMDDPQHTAQALELLERHMLHFRETYSLTPPTSKETEPT